MDGSGNARTGSGLVRRRAIHPMITFPTAVQTAFNNGQYNLRRMFRFYTGSGVYGFWTGEGTLVHGGVTYYPGALFEVQEPSAAVGDQAEPFSIKLAAIPEYGLSVDLLNQIDTEVWKGKAVTVLLAFLDPATGALLHVEATTEGYMDTLTKRFGGSSYEIEMKCETASLDSHRETTRLMSDRDQRRIDADDKGLRHGATAAVKKLWFGRTPPQ
jgi:hypothetical protein